jgi:hypothetical protein
MGYVHTIMTTTNKVKTPDDECGFLLVLHRILVANYATRLTWDGKTIERIEDKNWLTTWLDWKKNTKEM